VGARGIAGRAAVFDLARVGSLKVAAALAAAGSGDGVGMSVNRTPSSVSTRPVAGSSLGGAAGRGVLVREDVGAGACDGARVGEDRSGFAVGVLVRGRPGLETVRARVAAGVFVPLSDGAAE
jgi:hypothetical protein